jgi:hypothetical protein
MRKGLGKIKGLQEEEEGQEQKKIMGGAVKRKKTMRIEKAMFSLIALYGY